MGDIGDDFRSHKKERNKKKAENQERSTDLLVKAGIEFESKNGGNHLVVKGERRLIDFWPSTGKFIVRDKNYHGRGVSNLIRLIKGQRV